MSSVSVPTGHSFGRALDSGALRGLLKNYSPGTLANVLYPLQKRSVVSFFDDFTDTTFNADPWTVTKDTDAVTWAINAQKNGVVRGSTGDKNGEGLSLYGAPVWSGDSFAGMEVRFKIDLLTAVKFELGFIDDVSSKVTPVVTDVDGTPTFGSGNTEAAVISRNSADTITTPRLCTHSAVHTTSVGRTIMTPWRVTDLGKTAYTPTAGKFASYRIQLVNDTVIAMVFDENQECVSIEVIDAIAGGLAGGIDGAALLAPWVVIETLNTTAKLLDIDYVYVWQDR